ncbi:S8 family serine peptidase [Promicromonospora kroppenstedtii]|uniref:S8 family serine peptidase n=1 Tax=Promicromonospora kroppenstedtii TaxID=440482 RepID=UPI0004B42F88|nr:S8 family serine peptidase [Promicromonospora kroppenstedtii]
MDRRSDERRLSRGHVRRAAAVTLALALTATATSTAAGAPPEATAKKNYIVQMALQPVATYTGGVAGLAPTKPAEGEKVDPAAPEVVEYAEHLRGKHRAALRSVGAKDPLYQYVYSFDGFATSLTAAQAAELRAEPGVLAVTEDVLVHTTTADTTATAGDKDGDGDGAEGITVWGEPTTAAASTDDAPALFKGPAGHGKPAAAGEDVVIGVIDSGIWPDSASFSDRDKRGRPAYQRLRGFDGECDDAGTVGDDSWDDDSCNLKLVAAQHFNDAWGGDAGIAEQMPWEFQSARDYNGHGTHTASTAGGNKDVAVTGPLNKFSSTVSGVAPRARIAAYKALWSAEDGSTASGYPSDIVAAVDQAVADGVDVINFSVSGTLTDFLDPTELAFLAAAQAGVFVSASAGNSGPTAGTVAHPSPWITTVAAATHSTSARSTATLGDGAKVSGTSLAAEVVGPVPFVYGRDAAAAGATVSNAGMCFTTADNNGKPALDPAKVAGKIVLCDRGENARVNKGAAVAEAGGVGMVLVNTLEGDTLNTDVQAVPSVHVAATDRDALLAYARTSGATATIAAASVDTSTPAPYTAAFSSRGPSPAGNGNILKPDVTAPGQDILAAVAPPGQQGLDFNLMSGTSMSAPYVAGLAATLVEKNPRWSPMAVKSALMTTGSDVLDADPEAAATLYEQGGGHVAAAASTDPGLVYDSDVEDWFAFLCGATAGVQQTTCDALEEDGHSLAPSDLNTPSIAIGRAADGQQVTRTVTNVGKKRATYTAKVTGLDGLGVQVSPRKLTLSPGRSASFTVTFTRGEAELNARLAGHLTWSDGRGGHTVRSPIVLRMGAEAWTARFNGGENGLGANDDNGNETLLSPDGKVVYTAGQTSPASWGGFQNSPVTAAYDAETGRPLWSDVYGGPTGVGGDQTGFGISPDGGTLFVLAAGGGYGNESDYVTIAYDAATGERRWVSVYDAEGLSDYGEALAVSPDGSAVYVTGMSLLDDQGAADYGTVAYDAATGEELWRSLYDGPVGETDAARAIAASPDGSAVVVTGQSRGEGESLVDWGTVAFDAATGEQLWNATYDGPDDKGGSGGAVAITPDGTVVVTGDNQSTADSTDWVTIGYSLATGEALWTERLDGGSGDTDVPRTVVVSPDGGSVVITGNSWGEGTGSDYLTAVYDAATGEKRWSARYDGSGHGLDVAYTAAFSPSGDHVVVTGQSKGADTAEDFATVAYDTASGEQVWSGLYDAGESGDVANGVAVTAGPGSQTRIVVTGQSNIKLDEMTSDADMATLSYLVDLG